METGWQPKSDDFHIMISTDCVRLLPQKATIISPIMKMEGQTQKFEWFFKVLGLKLGHQLLCHSLINPPT